MESGRGSPSHGAKAKSRAVSEQELLGFKDVRSAPDTLAQRVQQGPSPGPPQLLQQSNQLPTVASAAAATTAALSELVKHPGTASAAANSTAQRLAGTTGNGITSQDLTSAVRKVMASGVGEWHLQPIQDVSPVFQQRVLLGPLGPETLHHRHGLTEQQCLQLYGLLHEHSHGFQAQMLQAVGGAKHKEQLLVGVWRAFADLWDDAVQAHFHSGVLAAVEELQATYQALMDCQDDLDALRQQNAELMQRCDEFVKANLDHMLAWRCLKTKSDALEGEVTMLTAANNKLSLRNVSTNTRNRQLQIQLEGTAARLTLAEQQGATQMKDLLEARAAIAAKDSALRSWEGAHKELEVKMWGLNEELRQAVAKISVLEAQLKEEQLRQQEADRRVADATRSYNLLHADFAASRADTAAAEAAKDQLEDKLVAMQGEVASAKQLVQRAHGWRAQLERCQMRMEELESEKAKQTQRRWELVGSYWPLMRRLREAQQTAGQLTQQVKDLGGTPVMQLHTEEMQAAQATATALAGTLTPEETAPATASVSGSHDHGSKISSTTPSNGPDRPRSIDDTQGEHQQDGGGPHKQDPSDSPNAAAAAGGGGGGGIGDLSANLGNDVMEELSQLRESYLLLQEEYWKQKEKLLELGIEAKQLQQTAVDALRKAEEAEATAGRCQKVAAHQRKMREKLEADIIGCKAWIRTLEETEQKYLKSIREQSNMESAVAAANRQVESMQQELAVATKSHTLQAAELSALRSERERLLAILQSERAAAARLAQAASDANKLELDSSHAREAQLQDKHDQQVAQLASLKAKCQAGHEQLQAANAVVLKLQEDLGRVELERDQLKRALQEVRSALGRLVVCSEGLEQRLTMEMEGPLSAALHRSQDLLEHVVASLQCLAADAAIVSSSTAAAEVEALTSALVDGVAELCKSRKEQKGAVAVVRQAAAAAGKAQQEELLQQLEAARLVIGTLENHLEIAAAENGKIAQALKLRERALESLEKQKALVEQQMGQLRAALLEAEEQLRGTRQQLAEALAGKELLSEGLTAKQKELEASVAELQEAEAAAQKARNAAAAAMQMVGELCGKLQESMVAMRGDAGRATAAASQCVALEAQVQRLQGELAAAQEVGSELRVKSDASWHQAQLCTAAARDAEFRAVETTMTLADTRRALEMTEQKLRQMQGIEEDPASAEELQQRIGYS